MYSVNIRKRDNNRSTTHRSRQKNSFTYDDARNIFYESMDNWIDEIGDPDTEGKRQQLLGANLIAVGASVAEVGGHITLRGGWHVGLPVMAVGALIGYTGLRLNLSGVELENAENRGTSRYRLTDIDLSSSGSASARIQQESLSVLDVETAAAFKKEFDRLNRSLREIGDSLGKDNSTRNDGRESRFGALSDRGLDRLGGES